MTELQRYLAEEIAEEYADRLITRREALRRLQLLGLSAAATSALLASFPRAAAAAALGGRPGRRRPGRRGPPGRSRCRRR